MKSKILAYALLANLLLGMAPLHAAEIPLDAKADTTIRNQVFESMLGYRNTVLFYTFAAENAVLVVSVDNKNEKFPITAELKLFAKETKAEGIAKWINNQHSDGLFMDVPEPVATHAIPATCVSVTNKKMMEVVKSSYTGLFNRYSVEFKMENVPAFADLKIKDFTQTADVYVKAEGDE